MSVINLYLIEDNVSKTRLTSLIPAVNDGVAINGFISFLKEEASKGMDLEMYSLKKVGYYDDVTKHLVPDEDFLSTGGKAEEVFKLWCEREIHKENSTCINQ